MIDLAPSLTSWFASPEAQEILTDAVRIAVREEVKSLLADELIDVSEAAKLLSMSEGAIRKSVERGTLPCVRIGRRVRFRRRDLLTLAE